MVPLASKNRYDIISYSMISHTHLYTLGGMAHKQVCPELRARSHTFYITQILHRETGRETATEMNGLLTAFFMYYRPPWSSFGTKHWFLIINKILFLNN